MDARTIDVVVGLSDEHPRPGYYIGIRPRGGTESRPSNVREALEQYAVFLGEQVATLQDILATSAPEEAERFLQDGVSLRILEVLLRRPVTKARFETLINALPALHPE